MLLQTWELCSNVRCLQLACVVCESGSYPGPSPHCPHCHAVLTHGPIVALRDIAAEGVLYVYTLTTLLSAAAYVLAAALYIMGMTFAALGCVPLAYFFGSTCYDVLFCNSVAGTNLMLQACDKAFLASPRTTRPFPLDVSEAICERDESKLAAAYVRLRTAFPPSAAAGKGEGNLHPKFW